MRQGRKGARTKDVTRKVTTVGSWDSVHWDLQETEESTAQRVKRLVFIHTSHHHWLRLLPGCHSPTHQPIPAQAPTAKDHPSQGVLVLGAAWECAQDVTWMMSLHSHTHAHMYFTLNATGHLPESLLGSRHTFLHSLPSDWCIVGTNVC